MQNVTASAKGNSQYREAVVSRGRVSLPFLLGLALVAAALLVAGCTPAHPQSTFDPAGPVARMQLNTFVTIFWAAVFVFVTVGGTLLFTVLRFRNRRGPVPQTHGSRRLEITWTLAPAIVLAVVAVPTIVTQFRVANPPATEEPFRITVTAHQWWWEFQYPDLGVVTANELHIPVDRVVVATLHSNDVIHSFWIPKLAGKVDVIPTRANTIWFKAEKPGLYFGQCAEFCGIAHAQMRLRVIAQPQEEFDVWVAAYQGAKAARFSGLVAEGATLFTTRACIACHTANGPPPFDQIGPNLTLFRQRTTMGAGILENTPDHLVAWLRDPDALKPGNRMAELAPYYERPEQALSEGEIAALVAYLQGLR